MPSVAVTAVEEIKAALESETRRAIAAAKRIPIRAAQAGWEFLSAFANDHVYSGGFRASVSIGLNTLPELDSEVASVTDIERHERAKSGEIFDPPDDSQMREVEQNFEPGDTIVIGSELWYADRVDQIFDGIISDELESVVSREVERGIADFNRRSEAAIRGTGGDVVEKTRRRRPSRR